MNGPQILSSQDVLRSCDGRVLLINPPVVDSRYEWIKWNQPLDLLKLSTTLKEDVGCQVKLFDFMVPNPSGSVPRRQSRYDSDLPPNEIQRWQYGQSWDNFDDYLDNLISSNWFPNSVLITTLASFWWQMVPLVANRIKNKLKSPNIILIGNYPVLETHHATNFCPNVDIVVNNYFDLTQSEADFSLYEGYKLNFCALDLNSRDPLDEISGAIKREITHYVFFNENLFKDFSARLKPILEEVINQGWNIYIHGICGIEPRDFPFSHVQLLTNAHFNELHLEPAINDKGMVDEELISSIMQACEGAGFIERQGIGWVSRKNILSSFLWIGRSDDDLEKLVWNALKLIQLVGMVIPKPFSPTPGTQEYKLLESKNKNLNPEDISPHRFPFAEYNGISVIDYRDYYRMTAFLNKKVRGHTFDFLGSSYLAQVIRESFEARRWDIPL